MGANYLLLGPEIGEKDDFVQKIAASLPPDAERRVFYPYDDFAAPLAEALMNPSLFAQERCVRIAIPEEYTSGPNVRAPNYIKKDLASILQAYYASPDPDVTTIVTMAPTQVNRELDAFFSKESPLFVKRVFWEMKDWEKPGWVRRFFSQRRLGISAEAVSRILLLVENNSAELRSICSKLASYFQMRNASSVDEDGVDAFLSHTRVENGYSLFAFLARRELQPALECVDSILASAPDKAAGVFAALVWSFRRLGSVLERIEAGVPQNTAFAEASVLGVRARIARPNDIGVYRQACLNYTSQDARRIIGTLAAAEVQLRAGGQDTQRIRLHMLVYDIIANKGHKAPPPLFPTFFSA